MSGFQTYLDAAQRQTGHTPREFLRLADDKQLTTAKVAEIVAWLEADFGLGHGHAANLAQLISKGPDEIARRYNDGEPLRLD